MMLCWSLDSDSCEGIVEETVFAAGFDDRYVVVARHPNESKKSIVEYYYLVRTPRSEDKEIGARDIKVRGPFDQMQFEIEKRRLHLPEFTRKFDDL